MRKRFWRGSTPIEMSMRVANQKFESGAFAGSMVITLDDLVKFTRERRQTPTSRALAA
jgi:hypothetical protein